MLNKSTLTFLANLKNNNDRKWFHANKETYQIARRNFVDVFDQFTGRILQIDRNLKDSVGESHIFRLNRDIRFSHNKDPYKFHFGAYIGPGGKANVDIRACYYLHIEPGNNFVGGGAYMPDREYLEKIRERIASKGNELQAILDEPKFKKYFGKLDDGYMLKTAPRGYLKDHEYIELLRYKSFASLSKLTDKEVLSEEVLDILMERVEVLKPLNDWLNNIYV